MRIGASIVLVLAGLLLTTAPVHGQRTAHGAPASADVSRQAWPGQITLQVDVSDVHRRIQHVRQTIPVKPGPLTLWYPQWIPGHHAPTGPINQIGGLEFTAVAADGTRQRLRWQRDPLDMYALHLDIPAGVDTLQAQFDFLSPTTRSQGRIAMTPQLLDLQWHRVVLYPAGHDARRIRIAPSITVPKGWQAASALREQRRDGDTVHYAPTTLEELIDAPVFAGRWFKRFDLDPGAARPVFLNVVADAKAQLDATPAMLAAHKALVRESDALFGKRPFRHYDFLLATSAQFSGIGLEHYQSSENGQGTGYLQGRDSFLDNTLLPHEYVHVWNGKAKRPDLSWTPHYNTPMRNGLLWVYEGQTEFWAWVLAARSGLMTEQQARDALAYNLGVQALRKGKQWRSLRDTAYQGIADFNGISQPAESWQRGFDFYDEGVNFWLQVDARLRQLSDDQRSMDDVAKLFFADTPDFPTLATYDDTAVIAALQAVQPHDWAGFLRSRLDDTPPPSTLEDTGWRLAWATQTNPAVEAAANTDEVDDFRFDAGLRIAREDGLIEEVAWDSPAAQAGLARDMQLLTVNGKPYSAKALRVALQQAAGRRDVLLTAKQAGETATYRIRVPQPGRMPVLERIAGAPDRLTPLLQARTQPAPAAHD